MKFKFYEDNDVKLLRSKTYNFNLDKKTGFFSRWGENEEDDPIMSPFGPEILDIEISEGEGCPVSCPFCYKGNSKGNSAKNMSLETFKQISSTLPKTVGQIAFGITSVNSHPQMLDIFQHCRDNGVIPNVTINGADEVSDEMVQKLTNVCGAMAVSVVWPHQEKAYNLIKRLTDAGNKQINIHFMISKQTIDNAYKVCKAMKEDPRLANMNAVVFLGLKPKSRGQGFDVLPLQEFVKLIKYCFDFNVKVGFDSCCAPMFDKAIESMENLSSEKKKEYISCSERCEGNLYSGFLDTNGRYWHCSFGKDIDDYVDVTKVKDFVKEVWYSKLASKWRKKLLDTNRECPLYPELHVANR